MFKASAILCKPMMMVVMIALGAIVAFFLIGEEESIEHLGMRLLPRHASVLAVQAIDFRAQVTAYGVVRPSVTLESKAQVSGKVSYIHPNLKQGYSLPAGSEVLRIEAIDYELLLKQTQADLQASGQGLLQLEAEEASLQRSLQLAKENLAVGEKEFSRIKQVWEKKLVSRSALDLEKQKVLSLQQQVELLQGQFNAFANRKKTVKANITRAEQQVKGQETNVGRTAVSLPFAARIGQVMVEKNEFVTLGSPLFEVLDIRSIEVSAQLPARHMNGLVSHLARLPIESLPVHDMANLIAQLNLEARVSLVGAEPPARWQAKVLRLGEALDPIRRTLSIVVGVDDPYGQVIPGQRPPLLKGMYVAVHFAAPVQQVLVLPRAAVHEGRVYVVGADSTLSIKAVTVQWTQNDLVVISQGLEPGDQVIVSDLYPIIEGMPIVVQPASALALWLAQAALGELTK